MWLKVRRLWLVIKHELPVQFGHEQLTSHSDLELVRRYFQLIGLNARTRCALSKQTGGDYGSTHMVLLGIGLLVVGARRLQHLRYLANNSLFARFCTLSRVPSDRTVVNWLKLSTQTSLGALMRLNRELLYQPGQHHGPRPAAVGANVKPIHGRSYDGPRLAGWLAQNTPGTLPPTNTTSGSGDNENGA